VFFKALVIIALVVAIFGTAAYYSYDLFVRPQKALEAEQKLGPASPPPDPTLPEFRKCEEILKQGGPLAARAALDSFVDRFPQSGKINEAKDILGDLNLNLFLSAKPSPEKQVYVVRPGDVLNKVARITKTTPELLMKTNGLTATMLRIGQQIYYTPAEFSLLISRKEKKVTLLDRGKFFKQYAIRTMPGEHGAAKKTPSPPVPMPKLQGKVLEKIAWSESGGRVIFTDKDYSNANHWIGLGIAGHTLYADPDPASGAKPNRPPSGGIGIAPDGAAELAVLLTKGNPVTIE
jgi:LysM domain